MPITSAISSNEILAGRWTGHEDVDELDNVDFEGHPIPQLMEISDDEDEESELSSDDRWDDGVAEDLLDILETNVELDACDAGACIYGCLGV